MTALPEEHVVKVLSMREVETIAEPEAFLARSLSRPLGYQESLFDMARGKRTACILICDITRPVPNAVLLRPILRELHRAGMGDADIRILIATGMHRPNVGDELLELVGEDIAVRYRVENHDAKDLSAHRYLGQSQGGAAVWLDARFLEADVRIATGFIEPHLMAGFSGGRKLIVPGIAGVETMKYMHGPVLLDHPRAREGILDGNPFHDAAVEIARMAGEVFIVNVALNERRQITGIFCGDLEAAHAEGVSFVRGVVCDTVPEPVDIVVTTGGGYPLDTTWYQTIKGLTAAMHIVREGGTIIIAAECRDGIGGEAFTRLVSETDDYEVFMRDLHHEDYFVIDQWQLQEFVKVIRKASVMLVSDGLSDEQLKMLRLEWSPTVEDALQKALLRHGGDASIAVIPKGPYILAEIGDPLNRH